MEIKHYKIEEIKPSKYNPRKITEEELSGLKESIKKFGIVDPLIVNTRTENLCGGHQRLKAAESLGYKEMPVVEVDLSLSEEKALNVALNSHTIQGKFDLEVLHSVLDEIKLDLPDLVGDLRFDVLEKEIIVSNDQFNSSLVEQVNSGDENSEWMSDENSTEFTSGDGYIKLIYHFKSNEDREQFVNENSLTIDFKKNDQWIIYK